MTRGLCIGLVALAALAAPAAADDGRAEVVRAVGAASIDADDPRAVAIDRAFARAVSASVDALIPPVARRRHDDVIRDKIVRRARLYVARYQVRQEGDDGESYRVELDAWIAVDRLRDALIGLGVAVDAATAEPASGTRARPKLVLLAVANVDGTAHATFGRSGGDGGPVGRAIARELAEYGFEVVGAEGLTAAVSASAGRELPVTDAAAAELARQVGAGGAVVIGAEVFADGKIRGTHLLGARGVASIRVLDTDASALVGEAEVAAATYGDSAATAADRGAVELGQAAVGAIAGALETHWPAAVVTASGVIVEVSGAATWDPIRAIGRALVRAPGVSAVELRRMRSGYIALEVATDLPAARIARALGDVSLDAARIDVRTAADGKVVVEVRPAPAVQEGLP